MSATNQCYYCRQNIANPAYVFKKTIYNKLGSEYGLGLTGIKKTTRYYQKECEVPRCYNCYVEHRKANRPALITGLITMAITAPITWFLAKRVYIVVIACIIAFLVGLLTYFMTVYRKRLKELGMKDENSVEDFPPIKDLLANGWQTMKP